MSKHTRKKPILPVVLNRTTVFALFVTLVFAAASIINILYTRAGEQVAYAATSENLNFQARLQQSSGSLVPDGDYHIEFKLYDSAAAGASAQGTCVGGATDDCLWVETRTTGNLVQVRGGYLSVNLGSVTAFPADMNWNQELYLTMNIGGDGGSAAWDGEMTPRIKLTAVPYAFLAQRAEQADKLYDDQGSFYGEVDFSTLTADRRYLLPDTSLATVASPGTICVYNGAASNCPAASGSAYYIQNDTVLQTETNYHIQARDNGTDGTIGGIIRGAAGGQTVDLFQVQASDASVVFAVGATGTLTVEDTATFSGGVVIANTQSLTVNSEAFTDLTGSGLRLDTGALEVDDSTATGFFRNGGNSFGVTGVLGTNDTNDLEFITNGVVRATFDQSNTLYVGNGATNAAPNNFTISGTGSTTAGTTGANLTLQSGAGASTGTGSAGGSLTLSGGDAGAGSTANVGGSVAIQGGNAAGTGNASGGGVSIQGGAGVGTGAAGSVNIGTVNTGMITLAALGVDTQVNGDLILGASAGSGTTLVNNGATQNATLALSDFATGGSIGSAASTVDIYTSVAVAQTTSGQTLAVPSPTNITSFGRVLYITNIGTADFNVAGVEIEAGTAATLVWSNTDGGASWTVAGASTNAILNQNSADQTADFRISGTGQANTSLLTPLLDAVTASTLSVGTSTATAISIGDTGVTTTLYGSVTIKETLTVDADSVFNGDVTVQSATDSVAGFRILDNDGGTPVFVADTLNERIGIGTSGNPGQLLSVGGTTGNFTVDGSGNMVTVGTFELGTLGATDTDAVLCRNAANQLADCSSTFATTSDLSGYVELQSGTPGSQQTGNLNISGVGIFGNGVQTNALDTISATTLVVGGTNATAVDVQTNLTADSLTLDTGALTFSGVATDITSGVNEDITIVANGTGVIYLNDIVRLGALPGTADTDSVLCINSNGQIDSCSSSFLTSSSSFIQNGNSFNATAVLGTNDAYGLQLETNNIVRMEVQSDGDVAIDGTTLFVDAASNRVGINTNTPSGDLSFGDGADRIINVVAQTTADTAGNKLTLQAGAGNGTGIGGTLELLGGDAGATNANGGNITLAGGAGSGTGVKGLVVVENLTFNTATTEVCATNCTLSQAKVDATGHIVVNATDASLEVTLPDPTNATAGRVIYITASTGTNDFTLVVNGGGQGNEIAMRQNTTATMIWNGSDWTAAGASSSTTLQAAYDNTLTSAGGAEIVLNQTGGAADGLTIRNNSTSPIIGSILEAQTSIGSNLFSVNNNATEYATNGGAESAGVNSSTFPTDTWSATPSGGTVSRYTTLDDYIATGQASVSVVTTAVANEGAANRLSTALTPNLRYGVSFAVRTTSLFSTLDVYYSPDGTNTGVVACTTAKTATQGSWTRVLCSFDAPASGITADNAIFIRQSDATARTFYVENLSVTVKANVNHAADGDVDDVANFATNWSATPTGGTVARDTNIIYNTSGSTHVTTTAVAGEGIVNNLSITPSTSTQYLVTFYARSSNTFDDIRVRYSRDGGTSFVNCVDYNTQSVSTTSWTRITCLFTTDGTAPTNGDLFIDQTTGVARDFYVDALSITLNTNTASNVKIGGGSLGGPTTLLTLDRSDGPPVAANNDAYLGSMYYDTTTGRIQCYEAGGWGTCGSPPDNIVNLNPEYAGSVLNGTGIGTMQADVCANESGVIQVNTSLCAAGEARNYYQWTSPQATEQTYSIYITYQLPSTFDGFASDDTVQLTGRVDSTTNAAVTYEMFRSQDGSIVKCGTGETTVASTADTWQTVGINGNESTGCGFNGSSANAFVMFKINLKANSNATAYVSTLTFTTTGR